MKLIDSLYKVISDTRSETGHVYSIELDPEHFIYKAHFPGEPITPGVCILYNFTTICFHYYYCLVILWWKGNWILFPRFKRKRSKDKRSYLQNYLRSFNRCISSYSRWTYLGNWRYVQRFNGSSKLNRSNFT